MELGAVFLSSTNVWRHVQVAGSKGSRGAGFRAWNARRFAALYACVAVSAAGCTHGQASTAVVTIGTRVVTPLTPSLPPPATESNACGNPWAVTATTRQGTVPLLGCGGDVAGLRPPPTVTITIGGVLTISGVPATAHLTFAPSGLLDGHGTTYLGIRSGTAVVTIHGYRCASSPNDDPRNDACPLLTVHIT